VEYRREINYSKINYSNNYGTEPKKKKKKDQSLARRWKNITKKNIPLFIDYLPGFFCDPEVLPIPLGKNTPVPPPDPLLRHESPRKTALISDPVPCCCCRLAHDTFCP
jgi:hypothetical protein